MEENVSVLKLSEITWFTRMNFKTITNFLLLCSQFFTISLHDIILFVRPDCVSVFFKHIRGDKENVSIYQRKKKYYKAKYTYTHYPVRHYNNIFFGWFRFAVIKYSTIKIYMGMVKYIHEYFTFDSRISASVPNYSRYYTKNRRNAE